MLMNLFPGQSMSDVLSSPEGQAVRAQLMDTIHTYSLHSNQQRSVSHCYTLLWTAWQTLKQTQCSQLHMLVKK